MEVIKSKASELAAPLGIIISAYFLVGLIKFKFYFKLFGINIIYQKINLRCWEKTKKKKEK